MTVTEWSREHRYLSERQSATPGAYRPELTPYLVDVMNDLGDADHREVVVRKPGQCGGSEAGRNALGYWTDLMPGPIMVVFPSEASARENLSERVIPMFEDSPRLKNLLTGRAWDLKKSQLTLRS
jgi:phage terminase large subunit GpA-like protein